MLALSTSWISRRLSNSHEVIQMLEAAELTAVELEYRLVPAVFGRLVPALNDAGISVTSLHNYCPHPGIIPKASPSGDYFRLSALDADERKLAVEWTARTIQQAHEIEACRVVLHCGAVTGVPASRDLYSTAEQNGRDSEALRDRLGLAAEQCRRAKGPFIEALLFSLDRLLSVAHRYGVLLALENRFHYHELPGYDDFELIFREFSGAPLGYWHDTGHAHALQMLGIASQEAWLTRYGNHLSGFHLHDALGSKDHLAPGRGEIDWNILRPHLEGERPLVLELAPDTPQDDIIRAADFARELLGRKNDSQTV